MSLRSPSLNLAILMLVLGNASAMVSDVVIKTMAADMPVFQFVLMRAATTLALLLPFWRQINRERFFEGVRIHVIRAHVALVAIALTVVVLAALPLATANAIFYAAPLLVMLLSVGLFGERLNRYTLLAVLVGFVGVLIILRPVGVSLAALGAVGVALALAVSAVLVRKLPPSQSKVHALFLETLILLPGAAALALWEGATLDWAVVVAAALSSLFILGYNVSVLAAYRFHDAGKVTSAEYTGIVWAVLFGWWWFGEVPDLWFYVGTTLIVLPLVLLGLQSRRRSLDMLADPG